MTKLNQHESLIVYAVGLFNADAEVNRVAGRYFPTTGLVVSYGKAETDRP